MLMTKDQIRSAALRLEPAEREALAEELLQSVSPSEAEEIDAAWRAEIRNRDAAYRQGQMPTKPVAEVLERLTRKARQ